MKAIKDKIYFKIYIGLFGKQEVIDRDIFMYRLVKSILGS